ncbi:unnamed protein product, partial [Allacma fusca]
VFTTPKAKHKNGGNGNLLSRKHVTSIHTTILIKYQETRHLQKPPKNLRSLACYSFKSVERMTR